MTSPGIPDPPRPLPPRPRIQSLDVIRGVAILGILLLNIRGFSMNSAAYWFPAYYDHFDTLPDRLTWFIGELFWSHKFYSLLAVLFGAGIVLMADSARASGDRPALRHYRRAGGLLLLGLLHAYLLWPGDILFQYGFCSAIAYPFRRLKPWKLVALALALFVTMQVVTEISFRDDPDNSYEDGDSQEMIEMNRERAEYELEVYRGPWTGQFSLRAAESFRMQTAGMTGSLETLGLMFLGMALLKTGWLGGRHDSRSYLSITAAACLAGWLTTLTGLIYWWSKGLGGGQQWVVMSGWTTCGATVAVLGYLAAIQWWVQSGRFPKMQDLLAAIGRTALSNYLLQSLLATFIFHGQGLGLIGRFGRAEQLLFVLLIWVIQIGLTRWWLAHHRQGPAEMLLRKITGRKTPA